MTKGAWGMFADTSGVVRQVSEAEDIAGVDVDTSEEENQQQRRECVRPSVTEAMRKPAAADGLSYRGPAALLPLLKKTCFCINDSLESYRELLSNTLDSYLPQVSNRLGTITKALSVVATISLPFVVVSGMWGMNFDSIPLQHSPHGFWTMLVLQLGLGAFLLLFLRWHKLL